MQLPQPSAGLRLLALGAVAQAPGHLDALALAHAHSKNAAVEADHLASRASALETEEAPQAGEAQKVAHELHVKFPTDAGQRRCECTHRRTVAKFTSMTSRQSVERRFMNSAERREVSGPLLKASQCASNNPRGRGVFSYDLKATPLNPEPLG